MMRKCIIFIIFHVRKTLFSVTFSTRVLLLNLLLPAYAQSVRALCLVNAFLLTVKAIVCLSHFVFISFFLFVISVKMDDLGEGTSKYHFCNEARAQFMASSKRVNIKTANRNHLIVKLHYQLVT